MATRIQPLRRSLPDMCYPPQLEVSPQPFITSSHEEFSPMQRERRGASISNCPSMDVQSSLSEYTLTVQLPDHIKHEMVTVSVLKGNKLKVIADAWHMETECELFVLYIAHLCEFMSLFYQVTMNGSLISLLMTSTWVAFMPNSIPVACWPLTCVVGHAIMSNSGYLPRRV